MEEQGSSGFQLSLAWGGLRTPEVHSCTISYTLFEIISKNLATQGGL